MDSHLISNIRIIHLTGTREERALEHGKIVHSLSREERKSLAFSPLSEKNQTLIKRAIPGYPVAGRMAARLYEAFVLSRFFKLSKVYRDRLEPFAKSSGLSLKTIWLSLYQPDFLMLLASATGEKLRNRFLKGMPGCSTVTVHFENEIYFLRNLDYPAAAHWEKNATVFYHEPSEPDLQKFVSISSLGIDTAGLTGWNAKGIAFSLHAQFVKKASLRGTPIFFLGEEILENAKTLNEAIAIAEKFRTIGSWSINLTSFSEKTSVCLELSNGKMFRRESKNGVLAYANDFLSPEFQKDSIHFNESVFLDSESRRLSLEAAGLKLSEDFTWPKALAALGSHVDITTGETRVFGNAPSVVTTIQSVGFDPKEKCLYVSTRNETPTGLGPYLKLPLFYDRTFFETLEKAQPELLEASLEYSESFLKALHFYYLAYVSWQVKGEDAELAYGHLVDATVAKPDDPHLWMQRGYFELMKEDAVAAQDCFDRALKQKMSSHLQQVARYFRAASMDLQGQREQALLDYRSILDSPQVDSRLARKAQRHLEEPFTKSNTRAISPDLQFAEPIDYR